MVQKNIFSQKKSSHNNVSLFFMIALKYNKKMCTSFNGLNENDLLSCLHFLYKGINEENNRRFIDLYVVPQNKIEKHEGFGVLRTV